MSWIDTIAYEKADAKLKARYDRVMRILRRTSFCRTKTFIK